MQLLVRHNVKNALVRGRKPSAQSASAHKLAAELQLHSAQLTVGPQNINSGIVGVNNKLALFEDASIVQVNKRSMKFQAV